VAGGLLLGEVLPEVGAPAFLPGEGGPEEKPGQEEEVGGPHLGPRGRPSLFQGQGLGLGEDFLQNLPPPHHPGGLPRAGPSPKDRPGHHVPGGELRQGIVAGHEPLPVGVEEDGPLSPAGLGDQGPVGEGRGVELDELQ